MPNLWLKLQGVKGPPSHGGEWFEILWLNLSGREKNLPVSMAVPLDATSQQFHEFVVNGKRFEKVTVFVQPQSELYFYDSELRLLRTHRREGDEMGLSFELWYERQGHKHSG